MEFEFDKEIDAILRQARTGETVFADDPNYKIQNPKSPHLDADDLAAFAENALPDKTKQLYTRHLADCHRCRRILADIISLNSEAEIETASFVVASEKTSKTIIPWYRKMFLFPQITYAMGFLVLIFSGFLAYMLILNPSKNSDGSQLSRIEEKSPIMPGTVANSNSMTTAANSSVASSANSMSNMTSNMANTATNFSSPTDEIVKKMPAATPFALNKSAVPSAESVERGQIAAAKPKQSPTAVEREKSADTVAPAPPPPPPAQTQPMILATRRAEESKADDKAKSAAVADQVNLDGASGANNSSAESAPQSLRNAPAAKLSAKKIAVSETRQSGGKTFTRKNGVWYDANYNNQPTINISRGSEDYKKLGGSLRSIAQSLSGTIVVVYQGKAYRIQ